MNQTNGGLAGGDEARSLPPVFPPRGPRARYGSRGRNCCSLVAGAAHYHTALLDYPFRSSHVIRP